jgi:predicted glutamine amidotransferase
MCRMMVKVGAAPDKAALGNFRSLALVGKVMPDSTCGHGDGWGFAALKDGALLFLDKSEKDGATDPAYETAAQRVAGSGADIVLGHLRKASVGDLTPRNAHPFVHGKYVFCHNGGVKQSERIPLYGLQPTGETDSERFFLNIVGRLETGQAKSLREACEQTVAYVHENHKYSSICFIITDGTEVLAYRDYRDTLQPGEAAPENFELYPEYYTLYRSKSANTVCSEILPSVASDWEMLSPKGFAKLI